MERRRYWGNFPVCSGVWWRTEGSAWLWIKHSACVSETHVSTDFPHIHGLLWPWHCLCLLIMVGSSQTLLSAICLCFLNWCHSLVFNLYLWSGLSLKQTEVTLEKYWLYLVLSFLQVSMTSGLFQVNYFRALFKPLIWSLDRPLLLSSQFLSLHY